MISFSFTWRKRLCKYKPKNADFVIFYRQKARSWCQIMQFVVSITQIFGKKFGNYKPLPYIRTIKIKNICRMNNMFGRFYYYYYFAKDSKVG